MERAECEAWLNRWISNYVLENPESAGQKARAEKPLRAAQVTVEAVKGKPGHYQAVAHLRPHFQLEALGVSLRLVAELPPPRDEICHIAAGRPRPCTIWVNRLDGEGLTWPLT